MKKNTIIVIIVALILIVGIYLIGFTNLIKENNNPDKYEDISYDEFIEMKDNDESFVVLVYQTGCSHCEALEPVLNKVIKKHDLMVYAVNLTDLDDETYNKFYKKTFVSGTPTIVYFEDGQLQANKLVGDKNSDELVNYFEEIGYIE